MFDTAQYFTDAYELYVNELADMGWYDSARRQASVAGACRVSTVTRTQARER
jgi:hypothetical protein